MRKRLSVLTVAALCMGLSGCSVVGGISSGFLVVLGLLLMALCAVRARSLALMRRRRRRRMTRRERAWLRRQLAMTNQVHLLSLVLILIGVALGLISLGMDGGKTPGNETPPTIVHQDDTRPDPTEPPAEISTEPPVTADPTEPPEPTEPDLIGIPQSLLDLMEKNPETTDFVLNYFNRREEPIDLSQIDRSQGVPLFMQWDPRWGYEIYGSDVIAVTGCAPTCMAMVGFYLTGDEKYTPDQMAEFAYQEGYYAPGLGTEWRFIGEGAEKLGLSSTELPLAESVIVRNLQAGNPIIVVVGPGDFTTSGHYIVLTGYENGMIKVNDPNRHSNSEKLWSYSTLEPQIRNLWAIKAG